jgi:hypothetical protein
MSRHSVLFGLVVIAVMAPAPLLAQSGQSAIAGLVRDSTGGVLPGVTVEASSPALIEQSKSAVTNENGQYRIVDLRPGTYKITFTLPGFSTIIRDGVVLEANFVAPVNVDMAVGTVEQSIIVTGESPIVDVQSSQRREVVNREMLDALPTGRSFVTMAGTVPAVLTGQFDVGGSTSMWQGGSLTVHGSLNGDSRTLIDGMVADAMFAGGQCSCVYDNEAQTQEIAVQVSGGNAESQLSGVLVNRIPRSGGNKFGGEFMTNFANTSLWSQNTDADLAARGFTVPAKLVPAVRHQLHRRWSAHQGPPLVLLLGAQLGVQQLRWRRRESRRVAGDRRQRHSRISCPTDRPGVAEEQSDSDVQLVGEAPRPREPLGHHRAGGEPGAEPAGAAHRAGEVDVDADESPAARDRLQPDLQQREVCVRTRSGRGSLP